MFCHLRVTMGGIVSSRANVEQINSNIAQNQSSELLEAVEEFVEQAFVDGSKVDSMKRILANPEAKKAFMEFLREENDGGEKFTFFSDMEKLKSNMTDSGDVSVIAGAKALVEQYKKPACEYVSKTKEEGGTEEDAELSTAIFNNLSSILDQGGAVTNQKVIEALDGAINETIVLMALSAFPSFVGSQAYKSWRAKEQQAVDQVTAAYADFEQWADTSKSQVVPKPAEPVAAQDSTIAAAKKYLEPANVKRIITSNSWLATFLGAAEALPICVTLADAYIRVVGDKKYNEGFPLIYVNKVFEETTGYKRERIRGTNCRFLQREKTEKDSIALLSNALANAHAVKVALTNFKSNGQPFKNLLAMKPVFDLDGNYSFVVGVQFDISAPGANAKAMKMVDSLLSLLPNIVPKNQTADGAKAAATSDGAGQTATST